MKFPSSSVSFPTVCMRMLSNKKGFKKAMFKKQNFQKDILQERSAGIAVYCKLNVGRQWHPFPCLLHSL